MKKYGKILACLLSILMIISIVPLSATATDGTDPDFSSIVKDPRMTLITDFENEGKGTLSDVSFGENVTQESGKGLKVVRSSASGNGWYTIAGWTLEAAQDWSGGTGLLIKVDFSTANTGTNGGHGVSVGIITDETNGTAVFNDPTLGGAAYSKQKTSWYPMTACVKYPDLLVIPKDTTNKYTGYVYIPFSAYSISGLDNVTGFSLNVGAITSGYAYVQEMYLVSGGEYEFEENEDFVTVTDFENVGKGTLSEVIYGEKVVPESGKGLKVERSGVSGSQWYQKVEWTFDEAQDFSNSRGLLVKVDFTEANSGTGTDGGHGISVGIQTADMGEHVAYNDTAKGGYAYNTANNYWQEMNASTKYSDLLIVYASVYKCYAGYIYIPFSAYSMVGLDTVISLTLNIGSITSGTGYVEEIMLVKGEEEVTPAIEILGVQDTIALGESTYDIRFVATINTLEAVDYGFVITATYTDATDAENVIAGDVTNTYSGNTVVYTGILANDSTVYAPYGSYFAPVTISDIPENVSGTFKIKPFATMGDGSVIWGGESTYTISAAE